jgi:hypothetical protein
MSSFLSRFLGFFVGLCCMLSAQNNQGRYSSRAGYVDDARACILTHDGASSSLRWAWSIGGIDSGGVIPIPSSVTGWPSSGRTGCSCRGCLVAEVGSWRSHSPSPEPMWFPRLPLAPQGLWTSSTLSIRHRAAFCLLWTMRRATLSPHRIRLGLRSAHGRWWPRHCSARY